MSTWDLIERHYDPQTQISTGQAQVIGAALAAAGPAAKFLVFGCGNDSVLWQSLNAGGTTLFVEDNVKWIRTTKRRLPHLWIEPIDYADRKVGTSLPVDEAALATYPVPEILRARDWDVILIDAPAGFAARLPGRSLSIYWSSLIANPRTHVFVDDYERPLERAYGDHFFRNKRQWNVEVPRVTRLGKRNKGMMLWSVGAPVYDYEAATEAPVEA